jgi:hypothetical protein
MNHNRALTRQSEELTTEINTGSVAINIVVDEGLVGLLINNSKDDGDDDGPCFGRHVKPLFWLHLQLFAPTPVSRRVDVRQAAARSEK